MFVDIINPKGVIETDILYKEKRKANGGKVSPEIAMEMLSYTNNFANVKVILKEIERLESKENRLAFKEFVLSCVDGRCCSEQGYDLIKKIATEGGYIEELEGVDKKDKVFHERFPRIYVAKSQRDLDVLNEYLVYSAVQNDYDAKDFVDIKNYDMLVVDADIDLKFSGINIPSYCDFSKSDKVDLNLANIKYMALKDGVDLRLEGVYVPKYIDFTKCNKFIAKSCEFYHNEALRFRDGACVNLAESSSLPPVVDLSNCTYTGPGGFYMTDWGRVETLIVKDEKMKKDILEHDYDNSAHREGLFVMGRNKQNIRSSFGMEV